MDTEKKITAEEIAKVKAQGFLIDKRTGVHFNGRVLTVNGKISATDLETVAKAAKIYGDGNVTMTTRLTLEIQRVPFEKIPELIAYLKERGLETGGTGAKVRPITSCKGTTCQYGLIDTFSLSERIHEAFYHGYGSVKLPHKFKISVGGCPNNCAKPNLNDIGIVGQKIPVVDLEKCRGCKVCTLAKACPIGVAKLENGKIVMPEGECNHCGRCVGKCPFKAVDGYVTAYKVYLGGRFGKKIALGEPMKTLFHTEEEVLAVIEKAILLFKSQGIQGERFADLISRIGMDEAERILTGDEILKRKAEILG